MDQRPKCIAKNIKCLDEKWHKSSSYCIRQWFLQFSSVQSLSRIRLFVTP